jgi:drug/metabolite transporter (DMT)-like permease
VNKVSPYLEIVFATLIWSVNGVFIKLINLPTTTIASIRLFIPAILIYLYLTLFKKENVFRKGNFWIYFASLINILRLFLYFAGFALTSVGNAIILSFTWPIFANILGVIFLKEKINLRKIILLAIAFGGIVVINSQTDFSFQSKDFLGMLSLLTAALLTASVVTIFKKSYANLTRLESVFFQNFTGAIFVIPFIFKIFNTTPIIKIAFTTVHAIFVGIIAFALFFSALKRLAASTVSILAYLEVIFGLTLSVLIINEPITWNMVLGGAMIIIATLSIKRTKDQNPTVARPYYSK